MNINMTNEIKRQFKHNELGVRLNHGVIYRGSPDAIQKLLIVINQNLGQDVIVVFEKTSGCKLYIKEGEGENGN